MNQFWKDIIQAATWIVAVLGGILAAALSIHERRAEFRWRRADKAKELIDDIHSHPFPVQACHMLDWHDGDTACTYTLKAGVQERISYAQVINALKLKRSDCSSDIDIFIHDCFDWFFYFVDRIEHSINRKLIDWLDVAPIFKPYARILSKDWAIFENFLSFHQYDLAKQFFQRYADPQITQTPKAASA